MKRKVLKVKKGFTLIEVIIAISMIVILASLSIPKITGYLDKAKDSNAISLGRQIYTAAMWSFSEKGGSFEGQSVLNTIQDTTSIQGINYNNTAGNNSSITVTNNSKSISIVFTSNSKDYLVEIDGDNNSYTIRKGKLTNGTQIFSSIQEPQQATQATTQQGAH